MLGEFTKREFRILLVNMKLSCKKAVALLGLAAFAQNKGCIVICDLQGINPIVFLGPTNHEENGREGPKHAPTDETNGGINDVGPPDVRRSVDSTSDKLRGTAWHSMAGLTLRPKKEFISVAASYQQLGLIHHLLPAWNASLPLQA